MSGQVKEDPLVFHCNCLSAENTVRCALLTYFASFVLNIFSSRQLWRPRCHDIGAYEWRWTVNVSD